MIGTQIAIDVAKGYEKLMLLEEKEKIGKGYEYRSLDHSALLISPEIEKKIGSYPLFDEILKTALSEISTALNDEWLRKIGYIIEVSIDEWKDTVIEVKVPIEDPEYVIQLWKRIDERVRKKIRSINADIEEINNILYRLDTSFEILE